MKKFEVTITETLTKKIIIDAETAEESENIADDMNFRGEIDWSSDVETDGDTVARELKL
jgi:hypothetical protein